MKQNPLVDHYHDRKAKVRTIYVDTYGLDSTCPHNCSKALCSHASERRLNSLFSQVRLML